MLLQQIYLVKEGCTLIDSSKYKIWNEFVKIAGSDLESIELIKIVISSMNDLVNNKSCEEVYESLSNNELISEDMLVFVNRTIEFFIDKTIGYTTYCSKKYNEKINSKVK